MTRAANAIYFNVPRLMPFLDPVSRTKHVLKDYLYAMLGCDENLACLRARCILDDKFTEPFLFFAASKELVDSNGNEWSVCDLAPIVDMAVAALEMGITTPATWMEEAYDIYAAVTHEAYAASEAAPPPSEPPPPATVSLADASFDTGRPAVRASFASPTQSRTSRGRVGTCALAAPAPLGWSRAPSAARPC